MLTQPSSIILLSILLLLSTYRNNLLFKLVAILYPILNIILLFIHPNEIAIIEISTIKLIWDYSFHNKLISYALLLITLSANCYGLGNKQKLEVIYGGLYCAFSNLCLFAGDVISLFIGLESMVLFASILLFLKNDQKSLKATKRYFITHLFSGSLILVGICHIITMTGSTDLISLTSYLAGKNNEIVYFIILIACLINIAACPFSGWMVTGYPASSGVSFIYLISFTTKISLIIALKLFPGLLILKFIGIILMLISAGFACIDRKLKRILCYLSLSSTGFALIGVSLNFPYLYEYIFMDILSKALLALILIMLEKKEITLSFELYKITNYKLPFLISIGIIISTAMLINIPFITIFSYIKYELTHALSDNYSYYIILLAHILTILACFSLLFKNMPTSAKRQKFNLNLYECASLYIILLAIVILNYILLRNNIYNIALDTYMFKQFGILAFAIISAYFIKPNRVNTVKLNFDLLRIIHSIFKYFYFQSSFLNKFATLNHLELNSESLDQAKNENMKFLKFSTQRASIFIIFSLLIGLILSLKVI